MLTTPYPPPADEEERLRALAEYNLMDTPPDEDFDRLVGLAARLFNVPIVLISLLARRPAVLQSPRRSRRLRNQPRHFILRPRNPPGRHPVHSRRDKGSRFASNPLVLGPPFIRFYAGNRLRLPRARRSARCCLIDSEPHAEFNAADRKNLSDFAALVMDRMETRRLDFAKTVSQTRFENIAATSPDAIICSRSTGEITFWNRSAERLFGYCASEIINKSGEILVPDSWRKSMTPNSIASRMASKMELSDQTIELSGLRKDGSEFPAEYSLSTWDEGATTSVGAIVRDITERRQNEERLFRLASLDALTDLPNRGRLARMPDADTGSRGNRQPYCCSISTALRRLMTPWGIPLAMPCSRRSRRG